MPGHPRAACSISQGIPELDHTFCWGGVQETVSPAFTCEELKDEHAQAHLLEHLVPNSAPTLKAPLTDIQNIVAPEDPAVDEVDEGKGQNDGAGGCIGQGYYINEHHDANFPPISDAVGPEGGHLVPVRLWRPFTHTLQSV